MCVGFHVPKHPPFAIPPAVERSTPTRLGQPGVEASTAEPPEDPAHCGHRLGTHPGKTKGSAVENLLTLMFVSMLVAIAGRHLRVRWQTGSAVDALQLACRKVWPAAPLTWAQLDQRVWRKLCASVTPGVSGHIIVPSTFLVNLSQPDFELIGNAAEAMADHLAAEMRKRARSKGWRITSGPAVVFRVDPDVYDGFPIVQHWFQENPPTLADVPVVSDSVPHHGVPQEPVSVTPPRRDPRRSSSRMAQLDIDTVLFEPVLPMGPGPDEPGDDLTQMMPASAQVR